MDEQNEQAKRDEMCRGLREVADFLESNPEAPLPSGNLGMWLGSDSKTALAAVARTEGKWNKEYSSYSFTLSKMFHGVRLAYMTSRGEVCERIVVGKKHVPAVFLEEREEDIVEWKCAESILKPDEEDSAQ